MRQECRERFPRHLLLWKPPVSDPGMHYGTCVAHVHVMHVGIANPRWWGNGPSIPGACATRNFAYLVRSPCLNFTEAPACNIPSSACGIKSRQWIRSPMEPIIWRSVYVVPVDMSWSCIYSAGHDGCGLYGILWFDLYWIWYMLYSGFCFA